MKPKKSAPGEMSAATSRPASTPEAQENYMINLAMKLVEKRLLEGVGENKAGRGKQAAAGKDRDTPECKALRGGVREGHCCYEEIQRSGRG